MALMTAVVTAGVHAKTYKSHPELKPVHENIGSSFWLYRGLISKALANEEPVKSAATQAVLNELHGRFESYWLEAFAPGFEDGYKLGGSKLTDEFVQAAAGKQAGIAGKHINEVSDRAFIEGYNAAVNKGWERAVAWDRISKAYGVDPVQMRKWVSGYPTDGYHPGVIPDQSERALQSMLLERSDRIAGHETWSAYQMGKNAEMLQMLGDGLYPEGTQKIWITAGDELVCPSCGPMNNESIAPDDTYFTDYGELYAPPMHINCRCDLDIHIPAYDVVTKAFGADKYDRDAGGKFAPTESRGAGKLKKKPKTGSPFVIDSEPDQWPSSGYFIARQGDTIEEKVDAKSAKKEAEELTQHLKNSKDDDNSLPYTAEQHKHNKEVERKLAEQIREDNIRTLAEQNALSEWQRISDVVEAEREEQRLKRAERQKREEDTDQFIQLKAEAEKEKNEARMAALSRNRHTSKHQSRVASNKIPFGGTDEGLVLPAEHFEIGSLDAASTGEVFIVTQPTFAAFNDLGTRKMLARSWNDASTWEEPEFDAGVIPPNPYMERKGEWVDRAAATSSGPVSDTTHTVVEVIFPDPVEMDQYNAGAVSGMILPRGRYKIVYDSEDTGADATPHEAQNWIESGRLSETSNSIEDDWNREDVSIEHGEVRQGDDPYFDEEYVDEQDVDYSEYSYNDGDGEYIEDDDHTFYEENVDDEDIDSYLSSHQGEIDGYLDRLNSGEDSLVGEEDFASTVGRPAEASAAGEESAQNQYYLRAGHQARFVTIEYVGPQ